MVNYGPFRNPPRVTNRTPPPPPRGGSPPAARPKVPSPLPFRQSSVAPLYDRHDSVSSGQESVEEIVDTSVMTPFCRLVRFPHFTSHISFPTFHFPHSTAHIPLPTFYFPHFIFHVSLPIFDFPHLASYVHCPHFISHISLHMSLPIPHSHLHESASSAYLFILTRCCAKLPILKSKAIQFTTVPTCSIAPKLAASNARFATPEYFGRGSNGRERFIGIPGRIFADEVTYVNDTLMLRLLRISAIKSFIYRRMRDLRKTSGKQQQQQ